MNSVTGEVEQGALIRRALEDWLWYVDKLGGKNWQLQYQIAILARVILEYAKTDGHEIDVDRIIEKMPIEQWIKKFERPREDN